MQFVDDIQPSTFTTQPTGHWTESNMREFLQNLAIERNLDPLLAETWYNVQSKDIRTLKVLTFLALLSFHPSHHLIFLSFLLPYMLSVLSPTPHYYIERSNSVNEVPRIHEGSTNSVPRCQIGEQFILSR